MSDEKDVEQQISNYTAGLWGDAETVDMALAQLAGGLSNELILNEQDTAVVARMCEIALARATLAPAERARLYSGVTRLLVEWMSGPTENRRITYPFLDHVALDEDLPANLRSTALGVLEQHAQSCVYQLLAKDDEFPSWLPPKEVLGPGLAALLENVEWLEVIRSALGLIETVAPAAHWRTTLVKVINLSCIELVFAMQRDRLFGAQPDSNRVLAEILSQPWLPSTSRIRGEAQFSAYLNQLCAAMRSYAGEADVYQLIYEDIAAAATFPAVPMTLRDEMRLFLNTHRPVSLN